MPTRLRIRLDEIELEGAGTLAVNEKLVGNRVAKQLHIGGRVESFREWMFNLIARLAVAKLSDPRGGWVAYDRLPDLPGWESYRGKPDEIQRVLLRELLAAQTQVLIRRSVIDGVRSVQLSFAADEIAVVDEEGKLAARLGVAIPASSPVPSPATAGFDPARRIRDPSVVYVASRCLPLDEPRPVDALEFLRRTLDESGRVVLLGAYGTGKSYVLRRLAAARADAGSLLRVPLARFVHRGERGVFALMADVAGEVEGAPVDPSDVEQRLASGSLIALFDGFDEIPFLQGSRVAPAEFFARLAPAFAPPKARVAITSRTSFFDPARASFAAPGFRVAELQWWNDDDWTRYVEDCERAGVGFDGGRARFLAAVAARPDLSDLRRRPLHARMLVGARSRVSDGHRLDPAGLFAEYAREMLERQGRGVLDVEQRLECMGVAAVTMHKRQCSWIPVGDLAAELKPRLSWLSDAALAELWAIDVEHYSLLERRGGEVSFGHRSFQEFFTARRLAERLGAGAWDDFVAPLSDEATSFLAASIDSTAAARIPALLRDASGVRRPAGLRDAVTRRNLLFIAIARDPAAAIEEAWLDETQLDDARLEGARLDRASLVNASLRRASLRGASLRGADLRRADLTGAALERTDLRDARLERCRLGGARGDARIGGARLDGIALDSPDDAQWIEQRIAASASDAPRSWSADARRALAAAREKIS